MHKLLSSLFLVCALFLLGCESEPVVGSKESIEFNEAEIKIDSVYVIEDSFAAKGTVKNSGSISISPVFYVEGVFFGDKAKKFKLGGANDDIRFSLDPGQSTGWTLKFKSSDYHPKDYLEFTVGELRVVKSN